MENINSSKTKFEASYFDWNIEIYKFKIYAIHHTLLINRHLKYVDFELQDGNLFTLTEEPGEDKMEVYINVYTYN